jgi:hypothetical protein
VVEGSKTVEPGIGDIELGIARFRHRQHLGQSARDDDDLNAGLLGERVVDVLLLRVAIGAARIADDDLAGGTRWRRNRP